MEMTDFFYLMTRSANSVVQAHPTSDIDALKLIKGEWKGFDFPIIFKQVYGQKFYDILHTGFPSFYLISEKMRNALEESHLTGWKVFPIKLYNKNDNEITGYHGFSIIGKSGPTSYKKSEIIEKRLIPSGPLGKYFRGISFDKWDGSDFFTPEGTYQIFITRKAANVLKKNKITNLYLENLAESEIHVRDVQKSERLNLD